MSRPWLAIVAALGGLAVSGCRSDTDRTAGAAPSEERERILLFWQRLGAATDARIAGDCTGARDLYLEALGLDPKHEDSLYYLGQCQRILKQPAEARQAFDRLVGVNPASPRGHLALGALLASSEPGEPLDLAVAETHLRRAHEINGEETGSMLRLGEVLIVQDRTEEARTWLEAAARTNPKSVEAAFLLGYLRWEAGDARGAADYLAQAARAARVDAPTKGVLGEGDRKVAAAGAVRAAPPLREPMGHTLFSELARPLKSADAATVGAKPDSLYQAVREARRAIAARRVLAPPDQASARRPVSASPRPVGTIQRQGDGARLSARAGRRFDS
jgi:tetratricopeptide (TPR) repeat protein